MALRWGRRVFHWASEHCGHFVVSFISMAWGSRSRYVCNWWHFSMVDRVMLFCQQNRFVNFRSFIFYLEYVHFRPGFHFLTIPPIYIYMWFGCGFRFSFSHFEFHFLFVLYCIVCSSYLLFFLTGHFFGRSLCYSSLSLCVFFLLHFSSFIHFHPILNTIFVVHILVTEFKASRLIVANSARNSTATN